ncbi:MAG TPA: DUF3037 domain-containing protein [Candidatus Angelobacter sp.]|nr:DUF3037 domain-containing protein [Candidatus Angelobacter sp.]
MTTTRQNCKFFLLRYVPDAIRNEFVNIGLVLLSPHDPPELRFARNWSRVQALDPQADTELLDAFRDELSQEGNQELIFTRIADSFSNILQASESKACLTAVPAQEADELARIYLEAPSVRRAREMSARQKIYQSMRQEFEQTGVWRRMWKDIPASKFSRAGDPLEIDCGYQADSTIKMFQAISLRTDITAAKVLAFSYPELAAGILRIEKSQAQLTAIVEDGLDQDKDKERSDEIEFALETLKRHAIQVARVSDLRGLAAMAARELRTLP